MQPFSDDRENSKDATAGPITVPTVEFELPLLVPREVPQWEPSEGLKTREQEPTTAKYGRYEYSNSKHN
jgi:hypothetical protein